LPGTNPSATATQPSNNAAGDAIARHLQETGWRVEEQLFDYQGIEGRNIIGRSNLGRGDVVILGAHYDTRKVADKTPGSELPVPGAVDGASGVAVLMELARSLELDRVENELWLAFFDVEDI
jgi:Zn-dependent M28 family amino/carboxypeptidase